MTFSQAEAAHLKYVEEHNFFPYQATKCILQQVSGYYDAECYVKKADMLKAMFLMEKMQSKIEFKFVRFVYLFAKWSKLKF